MNDDAWAWAQALEDAAANVALANLGYVPDWFEEEE